MGGDPKPNVAEVDANSSPRIWNTTDIKTKDDVVEIQLKYHNNIILYPSPILTRPKSHHV